MILALTVAFSPLIKSTLFSNLTLSPSMATTRLMSLVSAALLSMITMSPRLMLTVFATTTSVNGNSSVADL